MTEQDEIEQVIADLEEIAVDCEHDMRPFDANWTAWAADVARKASALLWRSRAVLSPGGYVALLKEAGRRVEASALYRRFISGTPLENDIAVWMADFASEQSGEPAETRAVPPLVQEAQAALLNPVHQVYFRAGLIACREYMARFVEAQSPQIAQSIRANWWPALGPDYGPPRKLEFGEVTDGEFGSPQFKCRDTLSPTLEALPIALGFLTAPWSGEPAESRAVIPEPPEADLTQEQLAELRADFVAWLDKRDVPPAVRKLLTPWVSPDTDTAHKKQEVTKCP